MREWSVRSTSVRRGGGVECEVYQYEVYQCEEGRGRWSVRCTSVRGEGVECEVYQCEGMKCKLSVHFSSLCSHNTN